MTDPLASDATRGVTGGPSGPLAGIRVVELSGQGPSPFACMLLADLGAEVVRVERADAARWAPDAHGRGRRSVALNLKDPRGLEVARQLIHTADVLVEGYRPGVAERLGVGPEQFAGTHPGLVYGRMTGWGHDGPLALRAGHDINYLAVSGVLSAIGAPGQAPTVPLNLVADYGGGGMFLAFGILAALLERTTSGRGQVVDAAMIDGVGLLAAPFHAMRARGTWGERGTNLLDGGAPYYRTYETSDGQWLSVGAIEPQFYRGFVNGLGLDGEDLPDRTDRSAWPALAERFASVIKTCTRDEWTSVFATIDACVEPVLTMEEAVSHPHAAAREAFTTARDGVREPAAAPRFSRTPAAAGATEAPVGEQTDAVLAELGLTPDEIASLHDAGAVA